MTVPSGVLRRDLSTSNVVSMTETLQQVNWVALSSLDLNLNDVSSAVDGLNFFVMP